MWKTVIKKLAKVVISHNMKMIFILFLCLATLCILLYRRQLAPPLPPEPLHAILSTQPRTRLGVTQQYDAIVLVSVDSVYEYETRKKGNWITHWYLCKTSVLQVFEGTVSETNLNVRFSDAWPTPESGIILDKNPSVFQNEAVIALWMKTNTRPYEIVFIQKRFWLANQGQLTGWTSLNADTNLNITRAVERHLRYCPTILKFLGETDDSYVVSDGPRKISIDKQTFSTSKYTGTSYNLKR